MTFGDSTSIRELCGNVTTNEVSANAVTNAITYGDSMVMTLTNKTNWVSTDNAFGLVCQASNLWGAAFLMKRFEGDIYKSKAEDLEAEASAIIDKILAYDTNAYQSSTSLLNTWPGESTATPYRSPGFSSL